MGIERNQQFIQESVRECRVLVLKQGSMEVVKSQDIDLDRRSKLSLCFFLSLVLCSELCSIIEAFARELVLNSQVTCGKIDCNL